MGQGSEGHIRLREHFNIVPTTSVSAGGGVVAYSGLIYGNVNDGSMSSIATEPGGVIRCTSDTADNDNHAVYTEAKFKPSDGGISMEVRVKLIDITLSALFVGFSETMSKASPVMPLEFASASMAYNGSGGIVGIVWDKDHTTPAWRAGAGDAGVVSGDADANGTTEASVGLGLSPAVNDRWDVIRVEIDVNGDGSVWLAQDDGGFKLIKKIVGAVTAGDLFHGVVMTEARTSAAAIIEIDYFNLDANIDWSQS